jgi:hypothetical protein
LSPAPFAQRAGEPVPLRAAGLETLEFCGRSDPVIKDPDERQEIEVGQDGVSLSLKHRLAGKKRCVSRFRQFASLATG